MKENYITPVSDLVNLVGEAILCSSSYGLHYTDNFVVDEDQTDSLF